ncbi:MAG: T9SS type A sorting domain-containing protein [Dysgonamonadaceae bacterium]|jgi:hypothetical protein|nr:T9SS type A sorting domain-containing protein [Dysgonamonadaceae bacterium]
MKKKITLGLVAVFTMAMASAQNISIDDFEGDAKSWEEGFYPTSDDGVFTVGPAVHFAVVENPWPDGINGTEKSGEFTSQGKPTLFGTAIGREIYFSKYPTIRLTAMAESGESNSLRVVVYNAEAGYEASGVGKTFPITGEGAWNVIEFNVSDYPSKPEYYNRIGFLFNPDTWEDNNGTFVLDEIELIAATTTIPDVLLRETFGFPNAEEGYFIGGTRYLNWDRFTSTNEADITFAGNDAGLWFFTPWGIRNVASQPYKDCESVAVGVFPGEDLYFSNIDIKNISTISVNFGYCFHDWNQDNADVYKYRPSVAARVDGGDWVTLTTESAFPSAEKHLVIDDAGNEIESYDINLWFLLEYPVALTGNKMDIRFYNENEGGEAAKYLIDNIIVKGFVGSTGLENIQASKVKAFVSNNLLTVNAGNVKEIVVYNVAGNKLTSNYNSNTLEVSSLSKGVYIASVVLENNQTTVVKFIK